MSESEQAAATDYGLSGRGAEQSMPCPELSWRPALAEQLDTTRTAAHGIGLFGCGGIAGTHLAAYKQAGLSVRALGNRTLSKAQERREEFFPQATVAGDWRSLVTRKDISIVDAATATTARPEIVAEALRAGKHVLSQKPFVNDLATGRELIALAAEQDRHLAVNMNGRFAPHFAWTRAALQAGLIGELQSVDVSIHWDHSWTAETAFDKDPNLILFDFGIHWFDMFCDMFAQFEQSPTTVSATKRRASGQRNEQALLARAAVTFARNHIQEPAKAAASGQASLCLHGASPFVQRDVTVLTGTKGAIVCEGPDLQHQQVSLHTANGIAQPQLSGDWFSTGFEDAMLELISAIELRSQPRHGAQTALPGLRLAFAACTAAREERSVQVADVTRLPTGV